jgi:hypothetical protein
MTVQDDLNAAMSTWVAAVIAYKTQAASIPGLNTTLQSTFIALKTAFAQALAGQTIDILTLATNAKTANDSYNAALATQVTLAQTVTDAATAFAAILAPAINGNVDNILLVMSKGALQ